jgi:hypothetical protein
MSQDSDGDDDEPHFASPEIQASYEAALGRFIVAFNQVDNLLTSIIEIVLKKLRREDLIDACLNRGFSHKLLVFDLLKSSLEGPVLKEVSVQLMRQIAGERNYLAHGFFDQNPFSGEYDIVGKNTRGRYSVERVDDLTAKANKVWQELRYPEAHYAFADTTESF